MKDVLLILLALVQLVIVIIIGYKRRVSASKYFMILVSVIALWTIVNASLDYAQFVLHASDQVLSILNKAGFFMGCLSLFFTYRLSIVFPTNNQKARTDRLITVLSMLFFISVFTPYVSGSFLTYGGDAIAQYTYGSLVWLVAVFATPLIILSSLNFITGYKRASILVRRQTLTIFFALIGCIVLAILFVVLIPAITGKESLIFFGYYAPLLFTGAIIYSIARHRLFDIRSTIARSLAYGFTVGILAAMYGVVAFGVGAIFINPGESVVVQRIFYIALAVVLAVTFQPLKKRFDKLTNRIFYQDAYDPQEFISELNKTIVGDIHIKKLLEECSDVIMSHLKVSFCIFGLKETESLPIRIIGKQPTNFKKEDIETVRRLTPHIQQKVIVADELESDDQELKDELAKYDIGALVRLTTNVASGKEGIGYIALGYKKSGSIFNTVDAKTLEIVANELVIAIQNAMQFEEIQQFNITLQQRVKEATHELEKTNKKLIALDETKDEFISMASHQLRTPLTSVKGFLSMLLDGDFGKIPTKQKDVIKEAFVGSQRMVFLISDFLNISRIRTGKFVIEPEKTDLPVIVTQEMEQLQEMAKSRQVELIYQPPVDFPKVMLDENKIRQVMMNFIDNAIYYTKKGGKIEIQLYTTADKVVYKVIDNGIGVPKSEQHRLFTKFFRARNAQKARPDGTGLGLFMAQKVIVAQGGTVIFESVEDKGSTFGFSFPLDKIKAKD